MAVTHLSGVPADNPAILISAIDDAAIVRMVGGNRALLREMVLLFFADYPKRMLEMSDALSRNNGEALGFAAHAMKGAAATLCAHRVVAHALAIDAMTGHTDWQSAAVSVAALERELVLAHAELVEIIGEDAAANS